MTLRPRGRPQKQPTANAIESNAVPRALIAHLPSPPSHASSPPLPPSPWMQEDSLPPPSPTPASTIHEPIRGRVQQPNDAGMTASKGRQPSAFSFPSSFPSSASQEQQGPAARPDERTLAAVTTQEQSVRTGALRQEQLPTSVATEQHHFSVAKAKSNAPRISYAAPLAAILQRYT